jgi:predicted permease
VVLETVLPTFAIIGVGFIYGRVTSAGTAQLSDYILYIASPCLIVTSLTGRSFPRDELALLVGTDLLYILLPGLVALFVLDRKREKSLFLPIMFQNTGNLGLPLALFAWGEEGMSKAIILYATTAIALYTFGVWIAAGASRWREVLRMPLIYAVMVPIVLNSLGYRLPGTLHKALDMVGNTMIPLLLVVLGVFLSRAHTVSPGKTVKGVVLRLGVGFVTGVAVVVLLGVGGLTRNVILLYSLMPSAVITTIFAEKFGKDPELVAAIVFTSTVASLILIPILLAFLG